MFSPRTVESFFRQEAGHRTQGGQDLRTVGGANRTAIFVVGSVPHVVMSIFDAPMPPCDIEQGLRVGPGISQGHETADGQDRPIALLAGGKFGELPTDPHDLCRGTEAREPPRKGLIDPDFPDDYLIFPFGQAGFMEILNGINFSLV